MRIAPSDSNIVFSCAVLYYFAGGYNPMEFPLNVIPPVLDIYLPLLFIGGLGMVLLAVIRRPPSAPA